MDEAPVAEMTESQESEQIKHQTQESDEIEPSNVVINGRRRGRRRVMKKRTVRDEEGFLGMYLPIICIKNYS
jgi:DNA polymerase delta subunit 3